MDWLHHPIALAARRYAQRYFGGRIGCMSADDAQQEGAIAAWSAEPKPEQSDAHAKASAWTRGQGVAIDMMRRHGDVTRNGIPRADRRSDTAQIDDALGTPSAWPTPDETADAKRKAERLAAMPERWQQVATGVLHGDDLRAIAGRLTPPVTVARVSQMLRQIILHVEGGPAPWRLEPGDTHDTQARPSSHAVDVAHALQAVKARNTLQQVIETQRQTLREIDARHLQDAERLADEAATARAMYAAAMGD